MERGARDSFGGYGLPMIDADVQRTIKAVLDTGLAANSITATVQQGYQPTTQGAPLDPVVIFEKISARRYGWQGRKYTRIPGDPDTFTLDEPYFLRPTYQVTGFMNQDPVDPQSLTAYDVLDLCAAILQSEAGLATFKAAGIGIDRVSDIRTPHLLDDSGRSIMDVNFDFVLVYENSLTSVIPSATVAGEIDFVN